MLKPKKTVSKTFKEKAKLLASVEKGMKQVNKIENGNLKSKPEKTFTIEGARAYSKKMIRKWASEK